MIFATLSGVNVCVCAVFVLKDGTVAVQEEMLGGGGARINDGRYQRFDLCDAALSLSYSALISSS